MIFKSSRDYWWNLEKMQNMFLEFIAGIYKDICQRQ